MKRTVTLLILLVLVVAGVWAAYGAVRAKPELLAQARQRLGLAAPGAEPAGSLVASGILEARAVAVSSDLGGRVTALHAGEGDEVEAGQPLLALDDSLLQARRAQVEAAVAVAQAQLDQLRAGARQEQMDLAQARVAQAESVASVARQAWDDAQLLRDNLQELDVQIVEAETAVVRAGHEATAARRLAEAADLQTALWGRVTQLLAEGIDVPLPSGGVIHVDNPAERGRANTQWNLSSQQAWEAWQTAYAAEDAVAAARTALADLRRSAATPLVADAQVHQAEAAWHTAEAAIQQARAALAGVQAGARSQAIALAQQAVQQAAAAGAPLEAQLAKTQLSAPVGGLVTRVNVHSGELAAPGAVLLEIADLTQVTLVVYVPQPELGKVRLGQAVTVTVDAHPGRVFGGQVVRVADQAEFTLRSLQTEEARASAVFAVEIELANSDGALKPGMPADAAFGAP